MAVKGTFAKASKVVLFVVNVLFWLVGIGILALGAYSEVQRKNDEKIAIINTSTSFGPVALMVGGALVLVIGFSGCCGAWKEHRGLLIFYAVLVLVIFAIQIAGGIFGFVRRNDLENIVTDGMKETQLNYDPRDPDLTDTKAWDEVQRKVKCCGVDNYTNWNNITGWRDVFDESFPLVYPGSCCPFPNSTYIGTSNQTVQFCYVDAPDFYSQGCFDEILSEVKQYWKAIAGAGVGVAVFELLVITMACCLQTAIKKDEYTAV
ncbi:CD63 antigen-like [Sycon ciliatum]|uniref:CD63 antigen-like n=1 Tax=Sycon ciliatum TaxID=27933 RepID=UPI0020AC7BB1|eukprot:scpid83209/ scgid34684/ CD63 antigen; Mast cell antigen AD1